MPTYEYRCKACGQELEVVQSFTDDALTTCEACGGQLRKVFGNVGIAFKGSGFYKNDSRGKSTSTAASSGADKGGESSSSGGTDSGGSGSTSTDSGSTSPKKDAPAAKKKPAADKATSPSTPST